MGPLDGKNRYGTRHVSQALYGLSPENSRIVLGDDRLRDSGEGKGVRDILEHAIGIYGASRSVSQQENSIDFSKKLSWSMRLVEVEKYTILMSTMGLRLLSIHQNLSSMWINQIHFTLAGNDFLETVYEKSSDFMVHRSR